MPNICELFNMEKLLIPAKNAARQHANLVLLTGTRIRNILLIC